MKSIPYFPIQVFLSHSLSAWEERKYNCLVRGEIDPIFHYSTAWQSFLWKRVFERYSPFKDAQGYQFYKDTLKNIIPYLQASLPYELISLGCGTGEKDHIFLNELIVIASELRWICIDTSLQLLLEACIHCPINKEKITPILSDILWKDTLEALQTDHMGRRIFTLFGILPNIDPFLLFRSLESVLSPNDYLVLSAHLAPVKTESTEDYLEGIESVLDQYDNAETRLWLTEILRDWGIEDKTELFNISIGMENNFFRIEATVYWKENGSIPVGSGKEVPISKGKPLRLFYSYRFTVERLEEFFSKWHYKVLARWIFHNKEEGIWLLQHKMPTN
ncbi:hypothetical protein A946_06275 [Methylacidiphilum kamchatkense Kam1]|uniref:Histidine-specific methyltransferase SAM-dependent domain-containing protein n=1 Tax=Methylacidiphilum kamchatkense Kam1 TaxID=1202785 RepID=A0A0C1UQ12_9BACT|nr:L-histidine N(alpha)-methyltransferase [Methylacidiphilum kamchatkense]KIE58494.1 hypothetical protein A946_06275 [Methylacidiphilum kamchatkense Kam1]QDQ43310.1 hypothetical protein kam1_2102 [Methylacidiphilum kamchatkense Kam1]